MIILLELTGSVEGEGVRERRPAVFVHRPQPHLVLGVRLQPGQPHAVGLAGVRRVGDQGKVVPGG